ncbi:MAG: tail fiber domain-containing protein [Phycisphaerae bacterium]|nr:tail fiber domain-containing protein [Phycisphaerae bacterium]
MFRNDFVSIFTVVLGTVGGASVASAGLLDTAITYQGQVKKDGIPWDGTCDLEFSIWSAASGGSQLHGPIAKTNIMVEDGLFTVDDLDFGAAPFDSDPKWLGIRVRCPAGGGTYHPLDPRQPLTAAPYALQTRGMFVDNIGRVGVAKPDPDFMFDVNAQATGGRGLRIARSGGASSIEINQEDGAPDRKTWRVSASGELFQVRTVDDNGSVIDTPLTITRTGLVGVGASPAAKLDVDGDIRARSLLLADEAVWVANSLTLDGQNDRIYSINGSLSFGDNDVSTSGLIESSSKGFKFPDGTVQTTASIGSGDGHSLDASDGNPVDALFVDAAGKVGIGTAAPRRSLDVLGQMTLRTGTPTNPGMWITSVTDVDEWFFGRSLQGSGNKLGFWKDSWHMTIRDDGHVGIGTTDPATKLHVEHGVANEEAIRAVHTLADDNTPAILGDHSVTEWKGVGVKGVGGLYGVLGTVAPPAATASKGGPRTFTGVVGDVYGGSERNVGVYGTARNGAQNYGVRGDADSGSGVNYGVYGSAYASTGTSYGVYGTASGNFGRGVVGLATYSAGVTSGVHGQSASSSGKAVSAAATASSGTNYAVWGSTSSPSGFGAFFTGPAGSRNYFERSIGIGTTDPLVPLAVQKSITSNQVGITQDQIGGSKTMELTTSDGSDDDGDGEPEQATRLLLRGGNDAADIEFYRGARGSEELSMFIEGNTGNVGIGTRVPGSHQLAIVGGNNSVSGATLHVDNTSTGTGIAADFRSNGSDSTIVIGNDGTGDLIRAFSSAQTCCPLFQITHIGRVGMGRNTAPAHPLHVGTNSTNGNGAHLTNGGVWTNGSDRNSKQGFEDIDTQEVLRKVVDLPITRWQYKSEPPEVRHIGPVAQDFYAAFGTGEDDRYIGTIDADGVALAAIQGLHEVVQQKDEAIRAQRREIETLVNRIDRLEAALGSLVNSSEESER